MKRRLAERKADLWDWIDYRPDANFWPFFLVPPFVAAAWAYVGTIGMGIVAFIALGLTFAFGVAAVGAALVWLVGRVAVDVMIIAVRSRSTARVPAPARLSAARMNTKRI